VQSADRVLPTQLWCFRIVTVAGTIGNQYRKSKSRGGGETTVHQLPIYFPEPRRFG
jgi:hypothetical protein